MGAAVIEKTRNGGEDDEGAGGNDDESDFYDFEIWLCAELINNGTVRRWLRGPSSLAEKTSPRQASGEGQKTPEREPQPIAGCTNGGHCMQTRMLFAVKQTDAAPASSDNAVPSARRLGSRGSHGVRLVSVPQPLYPPRHQVE